MVYSAYFFFLFSFFFFSSFLVYLDEKDYDPERFDSFADALWWGVVSTAKFQNIGHPNKKKKAAQRENLSSVSAIRQDRNRSDQLQRLARVIAIIVITLYVQRPTKALISCADAQADLHLCCSHMAYTGFLNEGTMQNVPYTKYARRRSALYISEKDHDPERLDTLADVLW